MPLNITDSDAVKAPPRNPYPCLMSSENGTVYLVAQEKSGGLVAVVVHLLDFVVPRPPAMPMPPGMQQWPTGAQVVPASSVQTETRNPVGTIVRDIDVSRLSHYTRRLSLQNDA